jgi:DNA-binding CsgD family transcriptional regulator
VLHLLLPHLRQLARRARPRGPLNGLTPREGEVLGHVAEGRTNAEIGWLLDVSPETVRKHLENAYAKLGVHTRTAAVALFGNAR